MEPTKKSISDLPPLIQSAYYSTDIERKVIEICTRHKMHIDEMGDVYDVVKLVILGEIPAHEFVKELTGSISLAGPALEALFNEINTSIFAALRSELERLTTEENSPPPATTPTETESPIKPKLTSVAEIERPTDILAAISNPSTLGTPNIYVPTTPAPSPSTPTPAPAPIPDQAPVSSVTTTPEPPATPPPAFGSFSLPQEVAEISSAEQKLSAPLATKPAESIVTLAPKRTMADDVKSRINSDPYKEAI